MGKGWLRRSFALRQAITGLLLALGIGFCFTILESVWSIDRERAKALSAGTQILDLLQGTAATAVWTFDPDLGQRLATDARRLDAVRGIELIIGTNRILVGSWDPDAGSSLLGRLIFSDLTTLERPLYRPGSPAVGANSAGSPVGKLRVHFNLDVLSRDLAIYLMQAFGGGLVRNLLLGGVLVLLFSRVLTRPLVDLAGQIQEIDPTRPERTMLMLPGNMDNELGAIAGRVNTLLSRLAEVQASLHQRKEELEATVAARTADLVTLNAELRESGDTLRLVGDIGREMGATLNIALICDCIYRRLHAVMPLDCFGVALLDPSGRQLTYAYYVEDGVHPTGSQSYSVDDPRSLAAHCLRRGEEVEVLDEAEASHAPDGIPEAKPMRTVVLRPLLHQSRALGVITIQSHRPNAFDQRDLQLFRSVAALAVTAIANAQAYEAAREAEAATVRALHELRKTQRQLFEKEKLASLGALVAGVAHEMNTPVGIAVGAASQLKVEVGQLAAARAGGLLKATALDEFIALASSLSDLVLANTGRAAELVRTFKLVGTDDSGEQASTLDLHEHVRDVLRGFEPQLRRRSVRVQFDGNPDLRVETHPRALAQVLTQLIQNALSHAFDGATEPTLTIGQRREGDNHVVLSVADNGSGMDEATRRQAFTPFFTSRRDQGSAGLGLHIVHNAVTGILDGEVTLETGPGSGTRISLRLPMRPEKSRVTGADTGDADGRVALRDGGDPADRTDRVGVGHGQAEA